MPNNGFLFGVQFADYIKSMIPGAKIVSGGKEIVCRCRYCMDSHDINHGHMYIHIPQSESDAPTFYCFKCHTSGIVNSKSLMEWGIYDPRLSTEIDKIVNNAAKTNKFKGYTREWYRFNNAISNVELAKLKLQYVNSRIGTSLTLKDCMHEKIILNLREALDYNRVSYTRHENIVNQLNDNFVGFLSLDNNFVNLRRICDEGIVYNTIDKRYINYNIFGKTDNTEKMYVIPSVLDLSVPKKINLHIAEGPFDILSIKHNLRYNEDGVYAAVTGSGYKGLVMYLITTFQIFYFDVHVYPDNDEHGNDEAMREIKDLIAPYGAELYVHRNTYQNEKDFGVPLNRIKEQVYTL